MFIPIPYGPRYIKKEDVLFYAQRQHKTTIIACVVVGLIPALMSFIILPKVIGIYHSLGISPSTIVNMAPTFSLLFAVMGIIFAFQYASLKYKKEISNKIKKYKKNDMINYDKVVLSALKTKHMIMLLIAATIAGMAIVIFPIYVLTSTIY